MGSPSLPDFASQLSTLLFFYFPQTSHWPGLPWAGVTTYINFFLFCLILFNFCLIRFILFNLEFHSGHILSRNFPLSPSPSFGLLSFLSFFFSFLFLSFSYLSFSLSGN